MDANEMEIILEFLRETDHSDLNDLEQQPEVFKRAETNPGKRRSRAKARKPRKNPNLSWLHRKQEILALRKESKVLESRLRGLHQRRELEPEKWHAGVEREKLQKAHEINVEHRQRLQKNAKLVVALEKILKSLEEYHKAQPFCEFAEVNVRTSALRHDQMLQRNDRSILNAVGEKLSVRCRDLSAILDGSWYHEAIEDADEFETGKAVGDQFMVKVRQARLVPFGLTASWHVIWSTIIHDMERPDESKHENSWYAEGVAAQSVYCSGHAQEYRHAATSQPYRRERIRHPWRICCSRRGDYKLHRIVNFWGFPQNERIELGHGPLVS